MYDIQISHHQISTKALTDVAQWDGQHPANQKADSLIPSEFNSWPGPWLGVCERQLIDVSLAYQCFSPPFSPSLSFSLKSQ